MQPQNKRDEQDEHDGNNAIVRTRSVDRHALMINMRIFFENGGDNRRT